MRRTWMTVLVLAGAGLVGGCGGSSDDPGQPDAASDSPSTSPTSSATTAAPTRAPYAVARITTGSAPCGILGVDGAVWVSNFGDDNLVRIDPATGTVGAPIPTGDQPCGLASGSGSIWVEDYGSDEVTRVSAADGSVEATYKVGASPYDVTFADGAAWVTNWGDGSVSRIDAASGKVTEIETGGTPIGIAPAAGKVWVGAGAQGIVSIDTKTSKVVDEIGTSDLAGWTAYDGDHVWINVGPSVVDVDATTGKAGPPIALGAKPEDGTVVGGDVWVGDRSGVLYRFPESGGPAVEVPSTVGDPFVAAELDGKLWVVDFSGTDVVQIDPALVG
jgi:YVTN family beta-propeller protein